MNIVYNTCDMLADIISFIQFVKQMRIKQKEYFRNRSKEALIECKKLEAEVDNILKKFNGDNIYN